MSRSIDERVVSMTFDSAKFEKNVSRTITALKALDLVLSKTLFNNHQSIGILDSLRGIAGSKYYGEIGEKLDFIGSKFTALGRWVEGQKDKIINSLETTVKSLSIDQVSSGWQKYADKTSAVQTIMAATAKDFNDTGKQMEYVNEQMDKLNWFTDETSYNFVDMVSNIGKFTSNDVKLQTAVTAMQGISTWAAISGANAQDASRAMYNLSQSLGVGAVKLQDWMSIENANMATSEFKDTVIETALALGTLEKTKDGRYLIKGTKDKFVTSSSFRENLSEGWFTSDVLLKALDKYGAFTDKLYELTDKTGTTATEFLSYIDDYQNGTLDLAKTAEKLGVTSSELKGYLEEATDETYDLGLRAFKAAQEAKTFEEALNSVKDAVSTGWMNTFELIFGDYQEAKKLWTGLANTLWDVFAAGGEARNELLRGWRAYEVGISKTYKGVYDYSSGTTELLYEAVEAIETIDGREILLEGIGNAFESLSAIMNAVKYSFRSVFPATTVERLMNLTLGFKDLTERVKEYFVFGEDIFDLNLENAEAFDQMSEPIKVLVKGLRGLFSVGHMVIQVFKDIGSTIFSVISSRLRIFKQAGETISILGDRLYELKDSFRESRIYTAFLSTLKTSFSNVISYAERLNGRIRSFVLIADKELNENGKWAEIEDNIVGFFKSVEEEAPKVLDELLEYFTSLANTFLDIAAWVKSAGIFKMVVNSIRGIIAVSQIAGSVLGDVGAALFSAFKSQPRIFAQIGDIIAWVSDKLWSLKDSFQQSRVYVAFMDMLQNAFSGILFYAGKALIKVKAFLSYVNGKLSENGVWKKLEEGLVTFFKDIQVVVPNIISKLSGLFGKFAKWAKENDIITKSIKWLGDTFAKVSPYVEFAWNKIKQFFGELYSAFLNGDTFSEKFKNLGSVLKKFGVSLKSFGKTAYNSLKNWILGKSGEEKEGNFFSDIFGSFSLSDWFENLKKKLSEEWPGIKEFMLSLVEKVKSIFSFVKTKISDIWTKASEWADRVDLGGILERLFSTFERLVKMRALWKFSSLSTSISEFIKQTGGNFGDIVEAFKTWKTRKIPTESLGSSLLKMAKGIAILAGAIVALGFLYKLDPKAMTNGFKMLGVVMAGLGTFTIVLGLINGKDKKIAALGASLYKMSIAIGILIGSIVVLNFIPWSNFLNGGIKLIAIMGSLLAFVAAINKVGGANLKGFLSLTASILILVYALKKVADIDDKIFWNGFLKLSSIFLLLGALIAVINKTSNGTGKASVPTGLISAAIAALSMMWVVEEFAKMNQEDLDKGLKALTIVMGGLALVIYAISKVSGERVSFSFILPTLMAIGSILTVMWGFVKMLKSLEGYMGPDILDTVKAFGLFLLAIGGITSVMGAVTSKVGIKNMAGGALALALGTLAADISAILTVGTMALIGALDEWTMSEDGSSRIERGAKVFGTTMEAVAGFITANEVENAGLGLLATVINGGENNFLKNVAGASLVTTLSNLTSDIKAIMNVVTLEFIAMIDEKLGGDDSSKIENGAKVFKTTMEAMAGFLGANDTENAIGGIIDSIVKALTKGEGSFAGSVAKMAGSNLISNLASDISAIMDVITLELIGVIDEKFAGDDSSKIENGAKVFKTTMEALGSFVNDTATTTLLLGLAGSAGVKAAIFGLATVSISVLSAGIAALGSVLIVELAGAIDDWFTDEKDPSSGIEKGAEVLKKTKEALDDFIGASNIENLDDAMDYTDTTLYKLVGAVNDLITDIITDLAIVVDGAVLLAAKWVFGEGRIDEAKEVVEGIGSAIGGFFGNVTGSYEGSRDASRLREFSGALGDFGTNLNTFTTNLEPFDEDLVTSAARVGDVFAELEKSLTEQGGIKQWFLGEKDIGDFGDRLRTFGNGLSDLATSIDDSQITQIGNVVAAAQSVIDLAKNAEDFNSWGFSNLSYDLTQMATSGFDSFVAVFSDEEGQMKTEGIGLIGKLCEGIEESYETLETDGMQSISHFCTGILGAWPLIETFAGISGSTFESNLKEAVSGTYKIGSDAADGYLKGLKSKLSQIKSVASQIGQVTKSALRNSIDSHSPSKDAYRIASDFVAGYNNSLRDSLPYVGYAAQALGEESILSLEDALAQLQGLIDGDMDSQPVITPVFDMSNLDGAMALMNEGLETTKTLDVTASKAIVRNAEAVSNSQIKMGIYNDAGVIEAINDLTNRVDNLNDSMTSMKIVLDTGATVGALAPAMDKQLGQRATYKGRGN